MDYLRTIASGALLLALASVCVAQNVEIKKVPIQRTSAYSGQAMYGTYCAVCHGTNGTGNGPAARGLRTMPANLANLAQTHAGTFPATHVYAIISGDANMPAAHGEKDMPMWAALFRETCGGTPSESEVHQRISNLTRYVESLQRK